MSCIRVWDPIREDEEEVSASESHSLIECLEFVLKAAGVWVHSWRESHQQTLHEDQYHDLQECKFLTEHDDDRVDESAEHEYKWVKQRVLAVNSNSKQEGTILVLELISLNLVKVDSQEDCCAYCHRHEYQSQGDSVSRQHEIWNCCKIHVFHPEETRDCDSKVEFEDESQVQVPVNMLAFELPYRLTDTLIASERDLTEFE